MLRHSQTVTFQSSITKRYATLQPVADARRCLDCVAFRRPSDCSAVHRSFVFGIPLFRFWEIYIGNPANSLVTSSVRYGVASPELGPIRTTTTSRERMTTVCCPMNPEDIKVSSGSPFQAPPRLSQKRPP